MLLIWGGLGLLVGGILNVLTSRLPYWDGPLWAVPLHCHSCQHPLAWGDVLPLFGFARQRGRCRHCGGALPWRFPLVEAATALLFALAYQRFGFGHELLVSSFYLAVLVLVFAIDANHRLILNAVTYPTALLAFALAFLPGEPSPIAALLGAATYGGFFALLYAVAVLLYRREDALGLGDVKLAIVIGMMTGLPRSLVAMMAGILLGSLAALAVLAGGRSAKSAMPYGTSLSVGAMLAILYGDLLVAWYVGS